MVDTLGLYRDVEKNTLGYGKDGIPPCSHGTREEWEGGLPIKMMMCMALFQKEDARKEGSRRKYCFACKTIFLSI
jgi:hypothetical protein